MSRAHTVLLLSLEILASKRGNLLNMIHFPKALEVAMWLLSIASSVQVNYSPKDIHTPSSIFMTLVFRFHVLGLVS